MILIALGLKISHRNIIYVLRDSVHARKFEILPGINRFRTHTPPEQSLFRAFCEELKKNLKAIVQGADSNSMHANNVNQFAKLSEILVRYGN